MALFEAAELQSAESVRALPGASQLVSGLVDVKWAIVTSASKNLCRARLAAAGLPVPSVLISADDVTVGKPNPECYRLAASRLGVAASRCVVIEDSGPGVRAAVSAGGAVVGLGARIEPLQVQIGPVSDLRSRRSFGSTEKSAYGYLK